jgi:phage terminase large subunit-like protein
VSAVSLKQLLRHPKERFSPFLLIQWERELLRRLFGTVDEKGRRLIRRAYLEICKKNGKSELAAGVALFLLVADDEPAAEIYGAATTKDQAGIVFRTAAAMVDASPILRKRAARHSIDQDDSEAQGSGLVLPGHLGRWRRAGRHQSARRHRRRAPPLEDVAKHFELLDVLTKGTIARVQPLVLEITTAGRRKRKARSAGASTSTRDRSTPATSPTSTSSDGSTPRPEDDDWTKEETWAKGNPSLETYERLPEARRHPLGVREGHQPAARQAAFKRYHLGIWSSTETEWMPRSTWAQNDAELKAIVERPCYLGLDLSSVIDLTSLVAVFPDATGPDEVFYDVLPFFWMANERVRERELADRVPYGTWKQQGALETTPGDVIDLRDIKKKIAWCRRSSTSKRSRMTLRTPSSFRSS